MLTISKDKFLTLLFYIVIIAIQFEEFQIGPFSVFQLIILPVSIIGSIIYLEKRKGIDKEALPIFLLIIWMLISDVTQLSVIGIINKLFILFFLFFITNYCRINYNKKIRYDLVFIPCSIICFITLLMGTANYDGFRYSGIFRDPNFACLCFLMSSFTKLSFIKKNSKKQAIIYILLVILDLYQIFLSQSRGGILALIIALIIFILFKLKTSLIRFLFLGITLFGLLSVYFYAQSVQIDYDEPMTVLLSRFQEDELETGAGRTEIWTRAFNYIVNTNGYLIPSGYYNYHKIYIQHNHNTFIDIALDAGVVTTICFLLYLLLNFIKYYRKRRCHIESFDSMFFIGVCGSATLFFLSAFNQKTFWFIMVCVIYSATNIQKQNNYVSVNNSTCI